MAYEIPQEIETDGLLSVQVSFHQGCALVYLVFGFVQVDSLFKIKNNTYFISSVNFPSLCKRQKRSSRLCGDNLC